MKPIRAVVLCSLALVLCGCGPNIMVRATTGAAAGAVAAGAPGAVAGAALGSSIHIK